MLYLYFSHFIIKTKLNTFFHKITHYLNNFNNIIIKIMNIIQNINIKNT